MKLKEIIKELGGDKLIAIYKTMCEIREFEERVRFLFLEGKMPGTIHQYIGMEACAVGVCSTLVDDDVIASTHRPHGHAIAKGVSIESMMAELHGKASGCCKGKGGSMHIGDIERGMLPAIAIVGANIPIIVGVALSFKLRKEKRVAVSFFGDGAANEGAFHEGLNMASIYNVPAIFVCENNQYGASTRVDKVMKIKDIADRAQAYGMRGDIADGMNVLEVYAKAKEAVDIARDGKGPTLLELKTFRLCGHSRRDANKYMSKEEMEYWARRDPILIYERVLKDEKILDESRISEIRGEIEKRVSGAIAFAQQQPYPKPEDAIHDFYVTMEVPE